jgi:hypothetical protein
MPVAPALDELLAGEHCLGEFGEMRSDFLGEQPLACLFIVGCQPARVGFRGQQVGRRRGQVEVELSGVEPVAYADVGDRVAAAPDRLTVRTSCARLWVDVVGVDQPGHQSREGGPALADAQRPERPAHLLARLRSGKQQVEDEVLECGRSRQHGGRLWSGG